MVEHGLPHHVQERPPQVPPLLVSAPPQVRVEREGGDGVGQGRRREGEGQRGGRVALIAAQAEVKAVGAIQQWTVTKWNFLMFSKCK